MREPWVEKIQREEKDRDDLLKGKIKKKKKNGQGSGPILQKSSRCQKKRVRWGNIGSSSVQF